MKHEAEGKQQYNTHEILQNLGYSLHLSREKLYNHRKLSYTLLLM